MLLLLLLLTRRVRLLLLLSPHPSRPHPVQEENHRHRTGPMQHLVAQLVPMAAASPEVVQPVAVKAVAPSQELVKAGETWSELLQEFGA